jgi:hypothetical protein
VSGKLAPLAALRVADAYPRLPLLPGRTAAFFVGGHARSLPRDGAALYRHLDANERVAVGDRDVLIYAGHHTVYCSSCGAYHGKAEGGRERLPCALQPDEASGDPA